MKRQSCAVLVAAGGIEQSCQIFPVLPGDHPIARAGVVIEFDLSSTKA